MIHCHNSFYQIMQYKQHNHTRTLRIKIPTESKIFITCQYEQKKYIKYVFLPKYNLLKRERILIDI